MVKPVTPPTKRADQLGAKPKRFWKAVAVTQADDGFDVRLDGRPVKTPSGKALVLPALALADAVAAEWSAVADFVDYEAMPLTRLAFAAIDRMPAVEADTVAEVRRFADTDLLCYPSTYPDTLAQREQAAWSPVLAWADAALDLQFHIRQSVIHQPQPPETLDRLAALVSNMSPWEQAGLMAAAPLFGSVILAVALWRGHIDGAGAFAASRIGEDFQSETWGDDAEAFVRASNMKSQALALETWFAALRS